jgi:7-keto-8-aminopelargonate synthetase-like enzyme
MASRLLRGNHPVWEEVESALAQWHSAEASLIMTSGYTANEGLVGTVIRRVDWVASDERNHASIIDGLRLTRCERFLFRHNDLDHLADGLKAAAARRGPDQDLFIVTESLFSMDGDRAPLTELVDLAGRHGAYLIVDEAHATGCFGPQGSGCVDEAGLRDRVLASVHTGGKALAVPGAYIVGSHLLKEYLVNHCRHLIFTTALPPQCGRWWLDRLPAIRSDDEGRQALHRAAGIFRQELHRHGITAVGAHYIVPVVVGDDAVSVQVARRLRERGFDVRAIRPPTVPIGTARIRIAVHADHDPALLATLAEALAQEVDQTDPSFATRPPTERPAR